MTYGIPNAKWFVLPAIALTLAVFGVFAGSSALADNNGAGAMSLSVDPVDTIACPLAKEPKGPGPLVCVPSGSQFSLHVTADAVPSDGYIAAQAWIAYGDELGDQGANGAVKSFQVIWPDRDGTQTFTWTSDQVGDARLDSFYVFASTGLFPPFPISHHKGSLFTIDLTCTDSASNHVIELIPFNTAPAGPSGAWFRDSTSASITPSVTGIEVNCIDVSGDTDGDGCPDLREQQTAPGSHITGGLRDYLDPNDYYDVLGPLQSEVHDGVIDLANDILGVIQHYSPVGAPPYDVRFDRGPTIGANHWERGPPDGVIDLANDILGVLLQWSHNCV